MISIPAFDGLDLRPQANDMAGPCSEATDVQFGYLGNVLRRPAFVKVCDVDANSKGLYAVREELRVAIATDDDPGSRPCAMVDYDPIDIPDGRSLVDIYDAVVDGAGTAWILAGYDNELTTLHNVSRAEGTQIDLPFTPGKTMVAPEGRLWLTDPGVGRLWISALEDFSSYQEPGSTADNTLEISKYAKGSQTVLDLAEFSGRVAVLCADAVQIWQASAEFSQILLEAPITGAGTLHNQSALSILNDVIYMGRGGFRSLSLTAQGLQTRQADLGRKIDTLTRTITSQANGIYSAARHQAIWAIDDIGYVMTGGENAKGRKVWRWSTWNLPGTITHWATAADRVFCRIGDAIYRLDDAVRYDDIGAGAINPQFATTNLRGKHALKFLQRLSTVCSGPLMVDVMIDDRPAQSYPLNGRAPVPSTIAVMGRGQIVRIRMRLDDAPADWRIDSLALQYREMKWTHI